MSNLKLEFNWVFKFQVSFQVSNFKFQVSSFKFFRGQSFRGTNSRCDVMCVVVWPLHSRSVLSRPVLSRHPQQARCGVCRSAATPFAISSYAVSPFAAPTAGAMWCVVPWPLLSRSGLSRPVLSRHPQQVRCGMCRSAWKLNLKLETWKLKLENSIEFKFQVLHIYVMCALS